MFLGLTLENAVEPIVTEPKVLKKTVQFQAVGFRSRVYLRFQG